MRPAIIFDDGLGQLAPLTDLRAAFDVRTGALTTYERLRRLLDLDVVAVCVPDGLRQVAEERHGQRVTRFTPGGHDPVLIINGRCVDPPEGVSDLQRNEAIVDPESGHVIAVCRDPEHAWTRTPTGELALTGSEKTRAAPRPCLISRPWHVRTFRDRCLALDLDLIAAAGGFDPAPEHAAVMGTANRVKVHPGARVCPGVVLDAEGGMIVIDEHATVRPGAIITGPAYIGPRATVLDRAVIRANTSIGPWCKVAGEVSGTIFQGYANKAHDGFLGDSYVGEWANLGAGTTNSNLLNTYGEVLARATPGSPIERTGETFLGCVIGDHAKFAICTRIMTGAVVHTGAMWAATAPASGCVASFAWVTDSGAKRYRFDKFAEVARTVMGRRGVTPGEAYMERLRTLHAESE